MTVIGVGNPFRSDDAVGPIVTARLLDHFEDDDRVRVVDLDGEPVRIIQAWEGSRHVLVVDAVSSGSPVGTIHRYTVDGLRGVGALSGDAMVASGHALGLGDAVGLAAVLDQLPPHLEVRAVEGGCFDLGGAMSAPVRVACDEMVTEIVARVHCWLDTS
ncbi:MAG: hydrogenase maturation protease [Acidimicrobiales bacterium]